MKHILKITGFNVDINSHIIYQGKDKQSHKPLYISTWQSVYNLPKEYFEQFDYVIVDEVHLAEAKSLSKIISNSVNSEYRLGMTGTLKKSKVHELTLEGYFGKITQIVKTKELIENNSLAKLNPIKCCVLKYDDNFCKEAKNWSYEEEIKWITTNEKRNRFIANLALSLKGNTLILFNYVDLHGKPLNELLMHKKDKDRKVFYVSGEVDTEERNNIRNLVENETNAIINASLGTFSTGINIKNLHNIIPAHPTKSVVRILQSIGRGLRKGDNKEEMTIFDIVDDLRYKEHSNYCMKHFMERIEIYNAENFEYRLYNIKLNGE